MKIDVSFGKIGIVIIAYYLKNVEQADSIIDDFCRSSKIECADRIIVDNSGKIISSISSPHSEDLVVAGDNIFWEFSGWLQGLSYVKNWKNINTIILLNDSYKRNWSVSPVSRFHFFRMLQACKDGRIAAWQDNFSYFTSPSFSRRPNSRIIFLPSSSVDILENSICSAITELTKRLNSDKPLFTPDEQKRIHKWQSSQSTRWGNETIHTREKRIFLEHHMFDALSSRTIEFFPKTWMGSILYAVVRRIFRERR